jgi:NTP pyrophosphatase (non-canonical NTP hydrolase)
MKKYQKLTKEIEAQFPNRWDEQTRLLHLFEEAGELSDKLVAYLGKKKGVVTKEDLRAEMCGILFDLFVLANQLDIDLKEGYEYELENFKKYIDLE